MNQRPFRERLKALERRVATEILQLDHRLTKIEELIHNRLKEEAQARELL